MTAHPLFAMLFALAIVPMATNAERPLHGLKDGAAKAAKAVGDTTKCVVDDAGTPPVRRPTRSRRSWSPLRRA